jgi:hypothetical protein
MCSEKRQADMSSAPDAVPAAVARAADAKPRFLGLDAGNWISLTALVLSILSLTWAVAGFVIGPKAELLPPTSVTFRYWSYGRDSLAFTGTTMNYINHGRKDYDALVVSEHVLLHFPERKSPLRLQWWWFVDAFGRATKQAHPVLIPGAGVASHETRFAPTLAPCASADCPERTAYANYMSWIEFLNLAKDPKALPGLRVEFVARVKERRYREIVSTCQVAFNDRAREEFSAELAKIAEAAKNGVKLADLKTKTEYFSFPCVSAGR